MGNRAVLHEGDRCVYSCYPVEETSLNIGIPFDDIPDVVLNDIALRLKDYLVPIFVPLPNNPKPHFRFIGSGSLVEIKGTHHVLTAAHVWHETRDAEQIGLVLTDYPSAFMIPRAAIPVKQLWDRNETEWGPDLALLELAAPFVSTIAAHKSFLNIAKRRAMLLAHSSVTDKGLWAVTGMVGEFIEVQPLSEARIIEATAQGRAFFSPMIQRRQHDGYDYLDLSAKMDLRGVPLSFGGVSGGGLWEVGLSMEKSGTISWDGRRLFLGVAFWQSAISEGRRVIRCHGPQSIFKKAWELWALP